MAINQTSSPTGRSLQETLKSRLGIAVKLRKETQKIVAQHTGLTPRVINSYLCGARVPTVERLVIIAQALRVTPDFLLGFSSTPQPPKDSLITLLESLDPDSQKLVAALIRVVLHSKKIKRVK